MPEATERERQAAGHGHAHAAYRWAASGPPARGDGTAWSDSELACYKAAYDEWRACGGKGLKRPLGLVLWDIVSSVTGTATNNAGANGLNQV